MENYFAKYDIDKTDLVSKTQLKILNFLTIILFPPLKFTVSTSELLVQTCLGTI